MYNLYYLSSTIDDRVYIGITNNPERRYYEHINYTVEKSHYNGNWIRKTIKIGGEIKMNIILSELSKEKAIRLEIKFIELFRKISPNKITNTAQGGLGFNHKGIPHSEEHKKSLEKAQPHKVRIPKEILYELYVNKNLSKEKIGKIYKCGATTVDRRLKEYAIPIRETKNYKVSYRLERNQIIDLYVNKKLSMLKISNMFGIGVNGIRTFLNREGIEIDSARCGEKKECILFKEKIEKIKKLLRDKFLKKNIAKELNISKGHLSYLIKNHIE